jgi:dipeptidyl aminopeptidase/acylaminoacyl peptidase
MHRGSPQWTNNGKGLVFSSNRNENWEYDFVNSEIYHLDIKEQSYSALTSRKGPDYNPVISPDGSTIAYLGYSDKVQTYQINELNLMNLDGSNKKQIKLKLDRKIQNLSWAKDGKAIFCTYDNHGDSKVAKIDLKGKVKVVAENLGGTAFGRPYGGGSYTLSDLDAIVYTTTSTEHPAEVKFVAEKSARMLTDLNADLLSFRNLAAIEDIWYESTVDGEKIQGWIAYPPNYDATKEYPLIVENHGGPISNYGFRFSPEIQLYAAAGYVVFYPNPRGSTGYGEKFGNLLYHNYPGDDYQDVMDGVDVLIKKGIAHEDKLYVTGGSAGGIMTAWMIGKNNRFEAAVVAKPVINWISKTLVADNYYGYAHYRYPGQPWENPMEYWKFSPISLVENVKTPTMVMVGMNDLRTPPSESKQYYHALKLLKVETALVEIPGASHGITGRPSQLITKVAHVLAWFENYK